MAHYGVAYQNLCNVQKALIKLVLESTDEKGAALAAREVRELEAYKRELRGKPRIKPVELMHTLKRANPAARALTEPIEVSSTPAE